MVVLYGTSPNHSKSNSSTHTTPTFWRCGKWGLVNQLVRDRRIAVLAVQEAHLDQDRLHSVRSTFGGHLDVYASPDAENASGARGVAFVVNKRIVKDTACTFEEIVPGMAALLTVKWHETRDLRILTVYAPNVPRDSEAFWRELHARRLGRVDLVLGDWNIVEAQLDRLPTRAEDEGALEALRSFRSGLNVVDAWRRVHPERREYTYLQAATGVQSRLDCIYVRHAMLADVNDWDTAPSGIPTDHQLVSVKVVDYLAPYVGKGRWAMPDHLLRDGKVHEIMKEEAASMIDRVGQIVERTDARNVQLEYKIFKESLVRRIRDRAREKVPKMKQRLARLRESLQTLLQTCPRMWLWATSSKVRPSAKDGFAQTRSR
ncbi:DNase I-like protein [Trametes sanguinea]|nr:DNase I-like protein [Trametes sanguinea]